MTHEPNSAWSEGPTHANIWENFVPGRRSCKWKDYEARSMHHMLKEQQGGQHGWSREKHWQQLRMEGARGHHKALQNGEEDFVLNVIRSDCRIWTKSGVFWFMFSKDHMILFLLLVYMSLMMTLACFIWKGYLSWIPKLRSEGWEELTQCWGEIIVLYIKTLVRAEIWRWVKHVLFTGLGNIHSVWSPEYKGRTMKKEAENI